MRQRGGGEERRADFTLAISAKPIKRGEKCGDDPFCGTLHSRYLRYFPSRHFVFRVIPMKRSHNLIDPKPPQPCAPPKGDPPPITLLEIQEKTRFDFKMAGSYFEMPQRKVFSISYKEQYHSNSNSFHHLVRMGF